MEAYLYIGTQGAMAEADEAEHFVPTKRLTPYDWERMKEFINSEKEGPDVHERHKLEINPELDEAVPPPPFHLREEVITARKEKERVAAGGTDFGAAAKKKKKKSAAGTTESDNPLADAEVEGVEPAAPKEKRKKKKRAVAT